MIRSRMARAAASFDYGGRNNPPASAQDASSQPRRVTSVQDASSQPWRVPSAQDAGAQLRRAASAQDASSQPRRVTSVQDASSQPWRVPSAQDAGAQPRRAASVQDASSQPRRAASAQDASSQPRRLLALLAALALVLPLLAACGQPAAPAAATTAPAAGGAAEPTATPVPRTTVAAPAGSTGNSDLKGTIVASGAFALYPMMVKWGEEFTKLYPGVQFDISAGGAGKGMADALAGAADIGMVSRDITKDEEGKGAWWAAVTKDAVLPMVNAANPALTELMAQGVTKEEFTKIFITGEITTWGQLVGKPEITDPINVYTRSDAAGAPETWAKYLGGKQENLKGIAVFGDPGLLDAVIKDKLGIGYNNLAYAYDNETGQPVPGALAIPVDADGNGAASDDERLETKREAIDAVATGKYPSPPARALNLVTKGQPSPLVAAFVKWVLTDGQQFVDEAGYVTLPQDVLAAGLEKVK